MKDLVEKTISESVMNEVKYIVCFGEETSKIFCRELEILGKRRISLDELRRHYEYVDYYTEFLNKIVRVAVKILGCVNE